MSFWDFWHRLDHVPVVGPDDARPDVSGHARERELAEATLVALRKRLLHLEAEILEDSHTSDEGPPR